MSDKKFVMALDEGTTSARAILFDRNGQEVAIAQEEFDQIYPEPGWLEHDPMVIWDTQLRMIKQVIERANATAEDVASIGITNQRETTVVWSRMTGKPIHNAVVWADRRTTGICDDLKTQGLEDHVKARTGLLIDAYFSGSKIAWILQNVPGARDAAEKGELAFGTIDSWLIWNLSGGRLHVTDRTNASRTMLYDIHALDWDDTLLKALEIPRSMLPEVRNSSELYGDADGAIVGAAIPLAGAVGDQQGALFGQACYGAGETKCTYGTAAALMMNTGGECVEPRDGMISTIGISLDDQVQYATEGVLFTCGSAIQWLRDGLEIIEDSSEAIVTTEDAGGVIFVPAFTGLSAPHWDPDARAILIGMTRGTTKAHIIRAALESIAFQIEDVLAAMRNQTGLKMETIRIDGGATNNAFVTQFQADISRATLQMSASPEASARGAAFLAGLAVGFWKDRDQLRSLVAVETEVSPSADSAAGEQAMNRWHNAVERCRSWV